MTSTGNKSLIPSYEGCREARHVMPRWLCGICPAASLGFPCRLWGLFIYFTSRICCSTSMLTTTSPLKWEQNSQRNL